MPPVTGGFQFQVSQSVLPPAPARTERGIAADRLDALSHGKSALQLSSPSLVDRSRPKLPRPLSQQSQAMISRQPAWLNHSITCSLAETLPAAPARSPGPQTPAAMGSRSVAGTWELTEATVFAQSGYFTLQRGVIRASAFFRLGR